MVEALAILGWIGSGLLGYGLMKDNFLRLWRQRHIHYDAEDENFTRVIALIGPIGLMVSVIGRIEDFGWNAPLTLTFRTPRQKLLPTPGKRGLIRQTGQERMMEKIRKAEERRKEEKMEQNRQLFLAWERETREKLDREIAEAREAYASLVPRLSQELLHLKPKDLVTADEEEYQYLDAQIKRKIGLGHGLACLSYRFWTNVFGRIKRDEDSVERKYGVFIAECVVAFYSASISSLCALVPCLFLGGIGVPIGCITTIASILAVAHTGKNFKDCHKCRYLQKSGFLARHNVRKGLAKSDLALPSLRS